jgi:hypothetical protein
LRNNIGRENDLFADAQIRRQFEADQVLLFGAGLRPNLADIAPVGCLGINHRQRLHNFLCAF